MVSDFSPPKMLILLLYRGFFNLFESAKKVRGAPHPKTKGAVDLYFLYPWEEKRHVLYSYKY